MGATVSGSEIQVVGDGGEKTPLGLLEKVDEPFKAARSAHRARHGRTAISRPTSEKGYVVAGAVDSTALGSHFGASLEDHGPNVVL
ncbi:hypothetical protein ACRAWF_05055 [Streptomyces sp. L7]